MALAPRLRTSNVGKPVYEAETCELLRLAEEIGLLLVEEEEESDAGRDG